MRQVGRGSMAQIGWGEGGRRPCQPSPRPPPWPGAASRSRLPPPPRSTTALREALDAVRARLRHDTVDARRRSDLPSSSSTATQASRIRSWSRSPPRRWLSATSRRCAPRSRTRSPASGPPWRSAPTIPRRTSQKAPRVEAPRLPRRGSGPGCSMSGARRVQRGRPRLARGGAGRASSPGRGDLREALSAWTGAIRREEGSIRHPPRPSMGALAQSGKARDGTSLPDPGARGAPSSG